MKKENDSPKTSHKSSLSKQFANPILVVNIQTGDIILDKISDSYLENL